MNMNNPNPEMRKTSGQQVVEKLRESQPRTAGERIFAGRIARAGGSRGEVAAIGAPSTIGATAPVTAMTLTDPIIKAKVAPVTTPSSGSNAQRGPATGGPVHTADAQGPARAIGEF